MLSTRDSASFPLAEVYLGFKHNGQNNSTPMCHQSVPLKIKNQKVSTSFL